jgi:sporulation protein YlmC with PRC-barrel domain
MMKLTTLAAFTALTLAFAPTLIAPAFAAEGGASDFVAIDHSMRSSKMIGMTVYNAQGQTIGKIEEIMVKAGASEPMAVIAVGDYVGGGQKSVGVPLSHISMKGGKASMDASKSQMAALAGWKFNPLMGGGG